MAQFEQMPRYQDIVKIWCDFNACGLSNECGDNCFYSFDRKTLAEIGPFDGMRVFIWDDDSSDEIIGYVAVLEKFPQHVTGWRARPNESTLYRGKKWWE